LDETSYDFLQRSLVREIERKDNELVLIDPGETAQNALQILAKNNISSAPIFDAKRQLISGYISVMDLATWIVRTYAVAKEDTPFSFDMNQLKMDMNTKVREVANWGLEPFWSVSRKDSILNLINTLFKWRVHRAPVVDDDFHITGSVSQFDVLCFLHQHRKELESVMNKSLKELGLEDSSDLITANDTDSVIKALSNIVVNQVTGLAIIDSSGKLVGNLSASDLKGLTIENFHTLSKPLRDRFPSKEPVTIKRGSSLGDAIARLVENKIHRVYVVDDNNKPVNVISLTSVMKAVSTPSENIFLTGRTQMAPLSSTESQ